MKGLLLILSLLIAGLFPPEDMWEVLGSLKFEVAFNEEVDDVIFTPVPNEQIKALEGQTITIKGFYYGGKTEENTPTIILSRESWSDYHSCIMPSSSDLLLLFPDEQYLLKEEELYTFQGKFYLNSKDQLQLPLQLKQATCLNCPKN